MPGVAERFLDVVLRVVVEEGWVRTEKLAVGIDRAWEGLRKPVEGYAVEDLGVGRGGVGPLEESSGRVVSWMREREG
jgi:hypothetical protein